MAIFKQSRRWDRVASPERSMMSSTAVFGRSLGGSGVHDNPLQVVMSPSDLMSRGLAFALDYIFIGLYMLILFALGWVANGLFPFFTDSLFTTPRSAHTAGFILITLPVLMYFTFQEAGASRGTWGKRQVRLQVCTEQGARLTWLHALGRNALKFAPWELAHLCVWNLNLVENPSSIYSIGLTVVWLLVGANIVFIVTNKQRQSLYDRIARTMVVG